MLTPITKENWLVYVSSVLLICIIIFELVSTLIPYFLLDMLLLLANLIMSLATLIFLFISVAYIFKNIKEKKLKAFLPLCLNLLFFAVFLYPPISNSLKHMEFSLKLQPRMEIVNSWKADQLTQNDTDMFQVPSDKQWMFLSDGGEVVELSDNLLFFFYRRGILDNFSGYIYSATGARPTNNDVQADIIFEMKMNDHWYFVSCT